MQLLNTPARERIDMLERSASTSRATAPTVIRTPDQRLRVFVSSALKDVVDERSAAREAITHLMRLTPKREKAKTQDQGQMRGFIGHDIPAAAGLECVWILRSVRIRSQGQA